MKFIKIYSLYSLDSQTQLALIKSILEAVKIPYYVTNENTVIVHPFLAEMDIMVQEDRAEEAKELLKDFYKKQNE